MFGNKKLKQENKQLQETINALNNTNISLNNTNVSLNKLMLSKNTKIKSLEDELSNTIGESETKIKSLETKIKSLEDTNISLKLLNINNTPIEPVNSLQNYTSSFILQCNKINNTIIQNLDKMDYDIKTTNQFTTELFYNIYNQFTKFKEEYSNLSLNLFTEVTNWHNNKTLNYNTLNKKYQDLVKIHAELEKENQIQNKLLSEKEREIFNLFDLDVYKNIVTSSDLISIQEKIKQCIKDNSAIHKFGTWVINNSTKEGNLLIKNLSKLVIKSFNNEIELLINKLTINNIENTKIKIEKLFVTTNNLIWPFNIEISNDYLKLKLQEIIIKHSLKQQKIEEKEELKQLQNDLKEQKKVEDEYAKELLKIEKEENLKNEILLKTKIEYDNILQELTSTHDKETVKLQNFINKLSLELELIKTNKERVKSLAEQTKRGFVYIISNEDSFGKNIFKIGLTRRLNPLERINELSNASVPFKFNIHGIIYSDDAPNLEKLLHDELDLHRVNKFNKRKEFFNTTLQDIKNILSINNIDYKIFESAIDISDFNIADSIILNNKN